MVEVYTDGSGTSVGLPGGYGFVVVVDGTKVYEESGHIPNASNNVAELTAALKGLEFVNSHSDLKGRAVTLISDSQLVLGFASGEWEPKKFHLMLLASKLNKLYKDLDAEKRWVKGHSGDLHNERCDELAKAARKGDIHGT
jgi:ribonuclease HI